MAGLPVAWIESAPHEVLADLTIERDVIVMIDAGSTQTDFGFGLRSVSCDLRPGAIGWFRQGAYLQASRWRWAHARRIAIDLGAAAAGDPILAEHLRRAHCGTEVEFHDDELASLLRRIALEAQAGGASGTLFAESLLLGIGLRLQRRVDARLGSARERGRLTPAQVRSFEECVRSRLGEPLTLAQLAATSSYSPAHFVRLFRNTFGCSPYQYVLRTRLEHARELVLSSGLPLSAIAEESGFASQSHMTASFVRAFGAPPGALRRAARVVVPPEPARSAGSG